MNFPKKCTKICSHLTTNWMFRVKSTFDRSWLFRNSIKHTSFLRRKNWITYQYNQVYFLRFFPWKKSSLFEINPDPSWLPVFLNPYYSINQFHRKKKVKFIEKFPFHSRKKLQNINVPGTRHSETAKEWRRPETALCYDGLLNLLRTFES